jgi:hypothetical protein
MRDNSVRRLGELAQFPGTGSTWRPSPGFRSGCNVPSNAEEGSAFFLCDLETGVFEKIKLQGEVQGWWDDRRILLGDQANNFILFDATPRKTNTLFSSDAMADSLREMDLTNGVEIKLSFVAAVESNLRTSSARIFASPSLWAPAEASK